MEYGSKFLAPVSHTSREMRPGEVRRFRRGARSGRLDPARTSQVDGKDFFFVDPAEIARMEKAGELIESTTIGDST